MLVKRVRTIIIEAIDFKVFQCSLFNALHMMFNLSAFYLLALSLLGNIEEVPYVESFNEWGNFDVSSALASLIVILLFVFSLIFHSFYRASIKRIKDKTIEVVDGHIKDADELEKISYPSMRRDLIAASTNFLYVTAPALNSAFFICIFSALIEPYFSIYLSICLLLSILTVFLVWYLFLYKRGVDGIVDSWVSAALTGVGFSFFIFGFYIFSHHINNDEQISTQLVMFVLILRVIYGLYKTAALGFFRATETITSNRNSINNAKLADEKSFINLYPGVYYTRKELPSYISLSNFIKKLNYSDCITVNEIVARELGKCESIYQYKNVLFCFSDILQGMPRSEWQNFCAYVQEQSFVLITISGSEKKQKKYENKFFLPLEEAL